MTYKIKFALAVLALAAGCRTTAPVSTEVVAVKMAKVPACG